MHPAARVCLAKGAWLPANTRCAELQGQKTQQECAKLSQAVGCVHHRHCDPPSLGHHSTSPEAVPATHPAAATATHATPRPPTPPGI